MARCPNAYRKNSADDTLRCKLMSYPNDVCAHTKYCRMTGHWENSDQWARCPLLNIKKPAEGSKNDGKQV